MTDAASAQREKGFEYQPINELSDLTEMSDTWLRKLADRDKPTNGWAIERRNVLDSERDKWPEPRKHVFRLTQAPLHFGREAMQKKEVLNLLEEASGEVERLTTENSKTKTKIEILREDRDEAVRERRELSYKLEEAQTELQSYKAEANEAKQSLKAASREAELLRDEAHDYRERYYHILNNQPLKMLAELTQHAEFVLSEFDFDGLTSGQKDTVLAMMKTVLNAKGLMASRREQLLLESEEKDEESPIYEASSGSNVESFEAIRSTKEARVE